tara:strand:+ start:107 stop:2374 length:2268 start_codon:yes stop_codon:yes gene_type:complete
MSDFLSNYLTNRLLIEGQESLIERGSPFVPLAPFVSPYIRKKRGFPLPSDFGKITGPEVEMEIAPMQIDSDMDDPDFYSPGYDPTTGKKIDLPTVTPIDVKEGMASYVKEEPVEEEDITSKIKGVIKGELDFKRGFNPITATERVRDISPSLGSIAAGGIPIGQLSSLGSFLNEKNLSSIAANAALGKQGYAVGMFEGQIIGTRPDYPDIVQGPDVVPKSLQRQITSKMRGFDDRAGVLGKAFDQYTASGGRFDMSRPISPEMKAYEDTVKNLKIPTSLKAELLGFNPNIKEPKFDPQRGSFGTVPTPQDYYTITPFEQIQKDTQETSQFRDDIETKPSMSMGLETDTSAQESIEESDSSAGFGFDDPFGGFDFKYGGRVNMYPGGFVSGKTKTIKGVGLIKPEETFMDTDVVRDRYAFDAENGDYIINGPASDVMRQPISALINYGIDELKKEGVDIRIGNPKIKEKNKVPLLTASSETYVPRIIAEKIGYPILEALNNIGKPEVERLKNKLDDQPTDKSKYEASEGTLVKKPTTGSFMTMEEANKALGVKSEPINPKTLKLFKSYNKKFKPQRGDVEKLLDNMNDKDKLALLIATETISTKDPFETLESVGQVVINRINDKQFPDFKNVNTLDEVLKQRSSRGTGTKMFQFDGLEPTSVKNRINEFLNKGGMRGYKRALMAAENVLTKGGGEPDYMTDRMPFNVLFYDKAGSPTSISRRYKDGKDIGPNELIDEYGKVGDHTFYTLHMTKEYP